MLQQDFYRYVKPTPPIGKESWENCGQRDWIFLMLTIKTFVQTFARVVCQDLLDCFSDSHPLRIVSDLKLCFGTQPRPGGFLSCVLGFLQTYILLLELCQQINKSSEKLLFPFLLFLDLVSDNGYSEYRMIITILMHASCSWVSSVKCARVCIIHKQFGSAGKKENEITACIYILSKDSASHLL